MDEQTLRVRVAALEAAHRSLCLDAEHGDGTYVDIGSAAESVTAFDDHASVVCELAEYFETWLTRPAGGDVPEILDASTTNG